MTVSSLELPPIKEPLKTEGYHGMRIKIPENSHPDIIRKSEMINTICTGYDALNNWSHQNLADPLHPRPNTSQTPIESLIEESRKMNTLIKTMRNLHSLVDAEGNTDEINISTFSQYIQTTAQEFPDPTKQSPAQAIEFGDPSLLGVLNRDLRIINHDIGNILGVISLTSEFLKRRPDPEQPKIAFQRLQQFLDQLPSRITEPYPQNPIGVSPMYSAFKTELDQSFRTHNIQFQAADLPPELESATIIWSEKWYQTLVENIISNTLKSQSAKSESGEANVANNFSLSANLSADGKNLEVRFADSGIGFNDGFSVFKEGRTGWGNSSVKGTGVGMANHAFALEEKYRGALYPEKNLLDENGQVRGAQIVLVLPLVNI
jgi:hypothetical protein